MPFRNEPDMWATIQENLRAYMSRSLKSAEQVAKYIEEYRADIAPDIKVGRAAIDHGTIDRFLRDWRRTHRYPVEILYRFLVQINEISDPTIQFRNRPATDPVFQLIQHFFGVRDRNIELCYRRAHHEGWTGRQASGGPQVAASAADLRAPRGSE